MIGYWIVCSILDIKKAIQTRKNSKAAKTFKERVALYLLKLIKQLSFAIGLLTFIQCINMVKIEPDKIKWAFLINYAAQTIYIMFMIYLIAFRGMYANLLVVEC